MFYCYGLKANLCFSFRSIEQFIIICYFSVWYIVIYFYLCKRNKNFLDNCTTYLSAINISLESKQTFLVIHSCNTLLVIHCTIWGKFLYLYRHFLILTRFYSTTIFIWKPLTIWRIGYTQLLRSRRNVRICNAQLTCCWHVSIYRHR